MSWQHSFFTEMTGNSSCPPFHMMIYFFMLFSRFFLDFDNFTMMSIGVAILEFILFEIHENTLLCFSIILFQCLKTDQCFSSNLRSFGNYFLEQFFHPFLFFLWDTHHEYFGIFDSVIHTYKALFIFLHLFSVLSLKLDIVAIFKFDNYLFYIFKYIKIHQGIFPFSFYIFNCGIFIQIIKKIIVYLIIDIRLPQEQCLLAVFSPMGMDYTFLSFCISLNFFLKIELLK